MSKLGQENFSNYTYFSKFNKTDNGTVSEELYFGKLGETVKTVRTINDGDTTSTYTTKYAFDNLGRMRTLTYPDGEILTYSYGKGGLLKSATGETSSGRKVYLEDMKYDEFGQRTYMKYGNGAESTYTYEPVMRRLTNLKTTSAEGKTLQNIAYQYDEVGNILSRRNSEFNTTDNISRNSEQSYTYDNRDRLTSSGGKFDYETWNPFWNKRVNTYSSDFEYNITGKILRKNQENKGLIEDTGETVTIGETTYDWNYEYGGAQPNAVTKAGTRTFSYDLNGNMTAMMDGSVSLTRTLLWDEENRLKKTTDSPRTPGGGKDGSIVTTYEYDSSGMRAIKKGKYGTVQYVSENYVVRNKDLISKHVFAGNTRLVSNMVMREEKSGKMVSTEQGCYYYHADHLGSSSVVTDKDGKFYEQLEYFPYGETWVHNKANAEQQSTPYKFTSKELDPETGLYYYGYRYLDPKLSDWTSADPALGRGDYFSVSPINDKVKNHNSNLPGMGGVFNSINLDAYQYAGRNPVMLLDPDGNWIHIAAGAIVGGAINGLAMALDPRSSVSDVLIATGVGTAAGGVAAATMGTNIPANMVIAGAISSISSYATQATTKNGKVDMGNVVASGFFGAMGGAISSKFSTIVDMTGGDKALNTAFKGLMDSGITIASSLAPEVLPQSKSGFAAGKVRAQNNTINPYSIDYIGCGKSLLDMVNPKVNLNDVKKK